MVLRLMHLLSPHRRPQGTVDPHEGTITTERPDQMWGTDGIRIQTVEDDWVWTFSAMDHCHGECVDNSHWRLEKLDFKTPYEVRQAAALEQAA